VLRAETSSRARWLHPRHSGEVAEEEALHDSIATEHSCSIVDSSTDGP
jgi:hypothetical protein